MWIKSFLLRIYFANFPNRASLKVKEKLQTGKESQDQQETSWIARVSSLITFPSEHLSRLDQFLLVHGGFSNFIYYFSYFINHFSLNYKTISTAPWKSTATFWKSTRTSWNLDFEYFLFFICTFTFITQSEEMFKFKFHFKLQTNFRKCTWWICKK